MACSNETAASQGAFAVQYVALLLLILTFILGTYANAAATKQRQAANAAAPSVMEPEIAPKIDEHPFGTIAIEHAFDADGSIASERIESIAEMLRHHDVTARIEVSAQPHSGDPAATIFGRMLTVQAAFRRLGVPAIALDVRGCERAQNDSVVISFRWSAL